MKAKLLKLKYPKNPGALLDKPEVVDYIWHLEDVGELDKLPLPFLYPAASSMFSMSMP